MKCDDCFHKEVCKHFTNMENGTYDYICYRFDPEQCYAYFCYSDVDLVHAEWKSKCESGEFLNCTNCGYGIYHTEKTTYCPNCGAKMDGEKGTD